MPAAPTVKFRLASFLAWGTGELEAAQQACEQARDLYTRAGEDRQALLAAREVGWIKGLRGDLAGMAEDSERVVREAQARRDRFVEMQGLAAVGYSANFRGAFAEGEAALRRAATIARADDKAYRLTVVLGVLAAGIAGQGRTAEARPDRRGEVVQPRIPRQHPARARGARPLDRRGLPDRARVAADAVAWVGAATRRRAFGMVFGGMSALEAGDLAQAEQLVAAPAPWSATGQWQFFPPWWSGAKRSWPGMPAGPAECVATLRPAATGCSPASPGCGPRSFWPTWPRPPPTRATRTPPGRCPRPPIVADFVGLPTHQGVAATASAWASLAAGSRTEPRAPREAVRRWRERLAAHLAGAHYALGRRRRPVTGRRGGRIRASRGAARAVRSVWRRNRALDALRRLGSVGRRAAAAALGPGSLTRREREVARLAAGGLSAKEIAAALFIGERTVESHLASTYAKLGVSSKLELVRRAMELGLA